MAIFDERASKVTELIGTAALTLRQVRETLEPLMHRMQDDLSVPGVDSQPQSSNSR